MVLIVLTGPLLSLLVCWDSYVQVCMHFVLIGQGGHWSGKSQESLIFLQGQGKVGEFCKLVREFLNTKKVREKSGNFIIWAKNIWVVAGILSILSVRKCQYFSRSLCSLDTIKSLFYYDLLEKNFLNVLVFWILELGNYTKRICHLSAARREKGRKNSVFWSGKKRIWPGKSHGILLLTEGSHPVGDRSTTSQRSVTIQMQRVTEHSPTSHQSVSTNCKPIAVSMVNSCQ